MFDPEVHWDVVSARYWAVAAEWDDLDSPSNFTFERYYFALAVSKTSDPGAVNPDGSPAWWVYRVDLTDVLVPHAPTYMLDAPSMAVDATKVCLTAARIQVPVQVPVEWYALVLDKPSLLNGTAGEPIDPLQPQLGRSIDINEGDDRLLDDFVAGTYGALAPKFGPMDGTPFYLVQADDYTDAAADRITLFAIRQDQSPPTTASITLGVAPYRRPADFAPQPLPSTFGISTGKGMTFWSAVYRNGSLWATHGIRNPSAPEPETARVRWYRFAMNGWPTSGQQPALFQWGELNVPAGIHAYLPSVAVDAYSNAAISFSISGLSQHLSMWYALKCEFDSTFRDPEPPLKVGQASFNFVHSGDYSGIDPDPSAWTIFYTHNAIPRGSTYPATKWESYAMRFDVPCGLDANGDGITTGDDMIAFTSLWQQVRPEADYRADGAIDLTDLASFHTDLYGPP